MVVLLASARIDRQMPARGERRTRSLVAIGLTRTARLGTVPTNLLAPGLLEAEATGQRVRDPIRVEAGATSRRRVRNLRPTAAIPLPHARIQRPRRARIRLRVEATRRRPARIQRLAAAIPPLHDPIRLRVEVTRRRPARIQRLAAAIPPLHALIRLRRVAMAVGVVPTAVVEAARM